MNQRAVAIAMIGVPLYVLSVFAVSVFAPTNKFVTVEVQENAIQLSFVGDMMFDRYIRERAEETGYPAVIENTMPLFASSTFVFGNLEGPITTFAPVSNYRDQGPDHYRFTFATSVARTLADTGFSAVTLGNNHALNFGAIGLAQTKEWLLENGMGYFGDPDDPHTPWRGIAEEHEVAVYAYDMWYANDTEELAKRLAAENADTFVVVFAHWGEEYDARPNTAQQELAHHFVDAGADFVLGSHPHVIQPKEQYRGAWIYYSLGNFVFDQYFSADVSCGAVVQVQLAATSTSYEVSESFIELARDGTTKPGTCATVVPTL